MTLAEDVDDGDLDRDQLLRRFAEREERERTAMQRRLLIWLTPASVGWVILAALLDTRVLLVAAIISMIGCVSGLLLHLRNNSIAARHLSCLLVVVATGMAIQVVDPAGHVIVMLTSHLAVCFVVFSWRNERIHALIAAAEPVVVLAISVATAGNLFGPDEVTGDAAKYVVAPASIGTTTVVLLFVLLRLTRSTWTDEAEAAVALDEARRANRAKSVFLANISHELRTPLSGVIGLSELVEGRELDPADRRHLQTIQTSARSALRIVDDLLDLSSIEAGKIRIDHVEMSPAAVIESVAVELAPIAAERSVGLQLRLDPDLPAVTLCDPDRLAQIVRNLAGNAVRFAARDGDADGRHGRVVLSATWRDADRTMRIEVEDDGIGMSAELLQRVFEPFAQGDDSSTRRYGGTGLGLSIVSGLVDRLGGTIGVESEVGEGSTFTVDLPCRVVEPAAPNGGWLDDLDVIAAVHPRLADEVRWAWAHLDDRPPRFVEPHELSYVLAGRTRSTVVLLAAGSISENQRLRAGFPPSHVPIRAVHMCGDRSVATNHPIGDQGVAARPLLPSELVKAMGRIRDEIDGGPSAPGTNHAVGTERSLRVLVVEDNPVNRTVIRAQLERLGHEVHLVDDGVAGLEVLRSESFDLVLSDVQMPTMDGIQMVAALRAWERDRTDGRVPVIGISAAAFEAEQRRCLDAGMDGYLTKPVTLEQLRDALSTVR